MKCGHPGPGDGAGGYRSAWRAEALVRVKLRIMPHARWVSMRMRDVIVR